VGDASYASGTFRSRRERYLDENENQVSSVVPIPAGCGVWQCGLKYGEDPESLSGRGGDDHPFTPEDRQPYFFSSRSAFPGMLKCGEGAYTGVLSGIIPGYRLSNRDGLLC